MVVFLFESILNVYFVDVDSDCVRGNVCDSDCFRTRSAILCGQDEWFW